MPYPSITAYLEAIQLPDSFNELVGIEPILNSNNEPILIAGGNAVVFKMRFHGKQVAIKCFTNKSEVRTRSYYAISSYLEKNTAPYFVTFEYYETELFIDDEEYPVVLMDWVEGKTLGTSMLEAYRAKDSNFLRLQASKLLDMFLFLLHQPIAHGDLKHENILVKENGELVLVDYDGMYIPTLTGKPSSELGSKGYQHPERDSTWFNSDLDNFSMLVLMLTHLYLAELPENCTPESSGQLFTEADYKSLGNSQINACFQYKICRQLASFLFDVLGENRLLSITNDFFRSTHTLINELSNNSINTEENNRIKNKKISVEYLEWGSRYQNGIGGTQNHKKAMEYYLKSAELGNSEAMICLGRAYYNGIGVSQSYSMAMEWFNKATNFADSYKTINLKNIHIIYLDHEFECLKEAAVLGSLMAHENISKLCYVKSIYLGSLKKVPEIFYYVIEKTWELTYREIAKINIGNLYLNGIGVQRSYSEAMQWYKEADNDYAKCKIGIIYQYGLDEPIDYFKAMECFKESADAGSSEGYFSIGILYFNGFGVVQDYEKAMEYFIIAADLGNRSVMDIIYQIYENGYGVGKDYFKAIYWKKKCNSNNRINLDDVDLNSHIEIYVDFFYEDGKVLIHYSNLALDWYLKKASTGDKCAMHKLGLIYLKKYEKSLNGGSRTRDYTLKTTAINWLRLAAILGSSDAMLVIAHNDFQELRTPDFFYWYEKSAKLGNSNAMEAIGNIYARKFDNDYNYYKDEFFDGLKAVEWYNKSAISGNSNAMETLGDLYKNGIAVETNYSKAVEWYEKAANLGNSGALNSLGESYKNGLGIEIDYLKAFELFHKAAILGEILAMTNIGDLYRYGLGVTQDYLQAYEWYNYAASDSNKRNIYAMIAIGELYQYGYGFDKDYLKAKEWFQKAATYGNDEVERKLREIDALIENENNS